jgi:hypothetical protein
MNNFRLRLARAKGFKMLERLLPTKKGMRSKMGGS